jgi:DNA-binding beta-propeller fold protein YncE
MAGHSDQRSGEKMKKRCSIFAASLVLVAIPVRAQDPPPLKLAQTLTLPADATGQFDHFGVDLKGNRLFATPEGSKSVRVFELKSGKPIHTIAGIEKPHAVLYREDLDRIYVTDGEAGDVKIFDGKSYKLLSTVKLLEDADSIGYDAKTKYLYIDNGGGDVHQTYSMLSVVDTTAGKKVADIKIDGETLEAMALESSTPLLYVNNKAKNQVDVVDREKRSIVASWPVTKCKTNVAMAFDEANHRLFVACRTGNMVVLDTQSGKEITALPITKGVDDIVYDAASKRIYAACDGSVDIYQQSDPDQYKQLAQIPTGPMARTARLVPELKRYFVAVPQHGTDPAKILVFDVL